MLQKDPTGINETPKRKYQTKGISFNSLSRIGEEEDSQYNVRESMEVS